MSIKGLLTPFSKKVSYSLFCYPIKVLIVAQCKGMKVVYFNILLHLDWHYVGHNQSWSFWVYIIGVHTLNNDCMMHVKSKKQKLIKAETSDKTKQKMWEENTIKQTPVKQTVCKTKTCKTKYEEKLKLKTWKP